MEAVEREYPHFRFRRNDDWENNNILVSLMCAEDLMDRAFITAYSDILYKDVVQKGVGRGRRTSRSAWTLTGASTTNRAPSIRRTTPRR